MKKLIVTLLLLIANYPTLSWSKVTSTVKSIPMHKERSHMGARTRETDINTVLEGDLLRINVIHFYGTIQIYILTNNDTPIYSYSSLVNDHYTFWQDISELPVGTYTIKIMLDNVAYLGILNL